jgi:outer membrane protein TolC
MRAPGPRLQASRLVAAAVAVLAALAAAEPACSAETLPIDFATALRLADERNLDVAIYYQRVAAATAALSQARLLALPQIRVGGTYDAHHGAIQDTTGLVFDADRASRFVGVGASVGVDVADAIFKPLAARRRLTALEASAETNRHQVLMDVAAAYLELLQARAQAAVVAAALDRAQDLADLTGSFAAAGEGLLADSQMAAVQPLLWKQRALDARANVESAAAELARLLHLDADVALEPAESTIPTLELFPAEESLDPLIARALGARPEAEQLDALVAAAEEDLKGQRLALAIPSVLLSYNAGDFGGDRGSNIANTSHRDDLGLQLYWRLDGLGFGRRARIEEKRAQLREVGLQRDKLHDAIVAQVRQAYASAQSRREQLPLADDAVTRATDAYELNRERIYDKQGLPLEALQAMQTLATAELARIDAVVSYDLAQIRLHTALGNPLGP